MRWGMAVDLKLCIGCNACVLACKAENGTPPEIFWCKVLEREEGTFPRARRTFWSIRCMHCQEPPCLEVCPTGATHQREDGIVLIDSDKCMGCGACIVACPYEARAVWNGKAHYYEQGPTPYEEVAYQKHVRGVVQKCTFCVDRIDQGLKPACVQTCPTSSLVFGDLDDPNSEVRQALGQARISMRLNEEQGTEPSIYYLT